MTGAVDRAITHLRSLAGPSASACDLPVTLNFHPDLLVNGRSVIELVAEQGIYRSQFETGTSSGGMTAFPGGERWEWESRIFGGAYDDGPAGLRPKYGALDWRRDPVGGARRFGSCHIRVATHVRARTSFCYPDSVLHPTDFAVDDVGPLVALAEENRLGLDPWLDNVIEAHVHGRLSMAEDVEAVVLDPSFRGTRVEEAAMRLGCSVEWHDGFRLAADRIADCAGYRNAATAEAVGAIAEDGVVTPAILGRARDRVLDYQTAKWVWHCVARFGRDHAAVG